MTADARALPLLPYATIRNGLPSMTPKMMAIMIRLRAAKEADAPCVDLAEVHKRTLWALTERDWIAESPGIDGLRHYVTARGLKALATYEKPPRYHYDGLCPTCGKRPRGHRSNGKLKAYCDKCQRAGDNREYAFRGRQYKPDMPCPRCKARLRHVTASGFILPYCAHCRRVLRKKERRAKMKRKLWLISIGRPPICSKCDQPVYHTAKTVYDYCYAHYRAQQNACYWKHRNDVLASRTAVAS